MLKTDLAPFLSQYPPIRFGSPAHCTYCGQPEAAQTDYVLLLSQMVPPEIITSRFGVERIGPRTSACVFCNGSLRQQVFKSFEERMEFIHSRFMEEAAKTEHYWRVHEERRLADPYVRPVLKRRSRYDIEMSVLWWRSNGYFLNLQSLMEHASLDIDDDKFCIQYEVYFGDTIAKYSTWIQTVDTGGSSE